MYVTEKGDLNVSVFSIDGQVASQTGKRTHTISLWYCC